MRDKLYATTIALAGIAQAVSLIKELAQTGKLNEFAYHASIYSLFQMDAPTVPAVYGDLSHLKFGLEKLITLLEPSAPFIETQYMQSVMQLQKKILRSNKAIALITQRLQQGKKQVDYFSLLHPTVIANLADVYLNVISIFNFRIIVWGNQRILTIAENTAKVRALLLAGVRSSVLWRQMGGSKIQLLFSRTHIQNTAIKILSDIRNEDGYPSNTHGNFTA